MLATTAPPLVVPGQGMEHEVPGSQRYSGLSPWQKRPLVHREVSSLVLLQITLRGQKSIWKS